MKPPTSAFFTISLSLAIGVIALALVTQNSNFSGSNPTITPPTTPTPNLPTPPRATPATNISYKYPLTFTYDYQKTDLNNSQTEVGYIITAAYHKDTPITININDFYLKLTVQAVNTIDAGTVKPQNNGTLTLTPHITTRHSNYPSNSQHTASTGPNKPQHTSGYSILGKQNYLEISKPARTAVQNRGDQSRQELAN